MQIPLALLHDPTSSANGKFYIGVFHGQAAITLHGPKTPGASGTVSKVLTETKVRETVRKKQASGYILASPSDIPVNAIINTLRNVERLLGLPKNSLEVNSAGTTIVAANGGSSPPLSRPRTRSKVQHIWI